jgi:hypothetical protein
MNMNIVRYLLLVLLGFMEFNSVFGEFYTYDRCNNCAIVNNLNEQLNDKFIFYKSNKFHSYESSNIQVSYNNTNITKISNMSYLPQLIIPNKTFTNSSNSSNFNKTHRKSLSISRSYASQSLPNLR